MTGLVCFLLQVIAPHSSSCKGQSECIICTRGANRIDPMMPYIWHSTAKIYEAPTEFTQSMSFFARYWSCSGTDIWYRYHLSSFQVPFPSFAMTVGVFYVDSRGNWKCNGIFFFGAMSDVWHHGVDSVSTSCTNNALTLALGRRWMWCHEAKEKMNEENNVSRNVYTLSNTGV